MYLSGPHLEMVNDENPFPSSPYEARIPPSYLNLNKSLVPKTLLNRDHVSPLSMTLQIQAPLTPFQSNHPKSIQWVEYRLFKRPIQKPRKSYCDAYFAHESPICSIYITHISCMSHGAYRAYPSYFTFQRNI